MPEAEVTALLEPTAEAVDANGWPVGSVLARCALALKGRSPQAAERLAQTPRSKVAISVITEMELRFGLAKHPTPHRLKPVIDTLLQTIKVLPLPDDIAVTYGALRAELERSGRPIGPLDTSSPRMQLRWGPCSSPTT